MPSLLIMQLREWQKGTTDAVYGIAVRRGILHWQAWGTSCEKSESRFVVMDGSMQGRRHTHALNPVKAYTQTGTISIMTIKDIHELISELEGCGELKRVKASVDADLEVAEILRREMYRGGPAILFENVKGYDMPILGNTFGSMKRLEIGLGMTDFTEIGRRIVEMTRMSVPSGLLGKLRKLPELSKMAAVFPKNETNGPVSEVVSAEPSFDGIPIIKSWPKDAGRFITLGMVATSAS